MRGSVKRDPNGKTWCYLVDIGRDPETGKRRQERRRSFRLKEDAQNALDERLNEIRRGEVVADRNLTVGEYLDQWIEAKEAAGLRASSVESYRSHIRLYLRPHLGRVKLRDLRGNHIERMLAEIAKPPVKPAPGAKIPKGAKRNPRPLSPATIRRVHATLRSALGSAKKKRLVPFNAAEDLELPRASRPRVRPWEAEELGRFLDHVQGDRLAPLFEVAAYTGLRRGELVGLRWDDIAIRTVGDETRGVITVRQQVVEVDGTGVECPFCGGEHRGYRFGPPKTASGEARRVDLDPNTVGVLLAQQLAQQAEREEWGDAYNDHGLVFAREDGSPIPPGDATARFTRLRDELGLPRVRLHDLRHGQASLMLAAGVPIAVVSKRLGHSSISITSDTYSHLLEGVGQQAAEAAASLVPRTKKAPESTSEAEGNQSATTRPNPNLAKLPSRAARAGQRGGAGGARTHDQRIMSPRL